MTSLVEEKDEDVRELCNQRREAEEACALAEAQKRTLEIQVSVLSVSSPRCQSLSNFDVSQLNDAMTSQEELSRLRMEQKRLSQECAENQQLISVLEMQRDILSKSVGGVHDQIKMQSLCGIEIKLLCLFVICFVCKAMRYQMRTMIEV